MLITKRVPTGRETGPTCAVWEVTLRCNQKCRFCGTSAGRPREHELTTAECIDVIRQLAELGIREVGLHGGEAYLRPDWLALLRAIRDRGMDATLVIGGRGFDATMAHEARAAGLTAVSVSVDGLETTHDDLRGATGSFQAAVAAMRHLQRAGVPVACNTQLNRRNYRELLPLVEALAPFQLHGWQVQLMLPMGRAEDASDLWLQPYDLLALMPEVARMRKRCDALGIRLWAGDNLGCFGPFEHTSRAERTRSGHSGCCSAGILTIGIDAHGDVKGCSAMSGDGFVSGNVRSSTIRQIWDAAPQLRISRDFEVGALWGFCRSCYYADLCWGGCVCTAASLLGRPGNNPYCHHRAIEWLAQGRRERITPVRPEVGLVGSPARFEVSVKDAPVDFVRTMQELERTVLGEVD